MTPTSVRIIGGGRAGTAFASALAGAGWRVDDIVERPTAVAAVAAGVDLVLLAVPDSSVAAVAAEIEPVATTLVAHLAGSLGLDALIPHPRRASIHPLVALPAGPLGGQRLVGAWFAVAASSEPARAGAEAVVNALQGRLLAVADAQRVAYHAAACIASNHLVALLGQVQRVAAAAGVPLGAYLDLVRATVDNVDELGPAAALTGPVARGDWATVAGHLEAIDPQERPTYEALAAQARRLVDPTFDPTAVPPWR